MCPPTHISIFPLLPLGRYDVYDLPGLNHLHTIQQSFEAHPLGLEICPQFDCIDGILLVADRNNGHIGVGFTLWNLVSGVILGNLKCSTAAVHNIDSQGCISVERDTLLEWGMADMNVPEIVVSLEISSDGTQVAITTSQVSPSIM